MTKITGATITPEQIEQVNEYVGFSEGSRVLSDYAYAFYYNAMCNELDTCDADRYANLNTILGYDVGICAFRSLDHWLWEQDFDLMELTGSDSDEEMLQQAAEETKTTLCFSKWRTFNEATYTYSYFENGVEYK